jgi:hypothetical protein
MHTQNPGRSLPGHRVTGDPRTKDLHRGIGYDHLHCVVDNHSRLAYVELHPREDAETNARTLERALRFFAELGLDPPEAVMTDNAMVYRNSRRFSELLNRQQLRHIRTPIYTPALERQSRTLPPNPPKRMGQQPHLAQPQRPRPLTPKLPPLPQPAAATQLTQRPATHQPRSQPPWAGQLIWSEVCQVGMA